ncbi:MAG: hypothetical protein NTX48_12325 [Planctomycetales bacterium]|nr:hypothetical protein [Planctomycetales bacterium]
MRQKLGISTDNSGDDNDIRRGAAGRHLQQRMPATSSAGAVGRPRSEQVLNQRE